MSEKQSTVNAFDRRRGKFINSWQEKSGYNFGYRGHQKYVTKLLLLFRSINNF